MFFAFILSAKRFEFCWARDQYLDCYQCGDNDPIPWNCSATKNETHAITVCVIPSAVADKCTRVSIDRLTFFPTKVKVCSIELNRVQRDLNNSVISNSFVALHNEIDLRNVTVADECIIQLESFEELREKESQDDTFACYCTRDYCNRKLTLLISLSIETPPPPLIVTNKSDVNTTDAGTYDPVGNSYVAAIILGVVLLSLLVATVLLWLLLVIRLRQKRKQQELLVPGQEGSIECSHEVSSSDVEVESIQE